MEIASIQYKNEKTILLLYLGQRSGKHCGILLNVISDSDRSEMVKKKTIINGLSFEDKLIYIKELAPTAFKIGYREIKLENGRIIEKHKI